MRYPIKASVVFTWAGPAGRLQGEGVTRDINGMGAYIRTSTCPPFAVTAQMDVILPPIEPTRKSMKVAMEGRVIRVERPETNEAQGGFAFLSKGFAVVDVGSKQD